MPCEEITKAIAWSKKSNDNEVFPVQAYLTIHNGMKSKEPIAGGAADDQVWYATGSVKAATSPNPHLSGTLSQVWTNGSDGVMNTKPKLSVKVKIFADQTVTYQKLIDGQPIGGVQPAKFTATCVDDDLLTGLDGGMVVTVGVARRQSESLVPV